jgi:hypothetical protein
MTGARSQGAGQEDAGGFGAAALVFAGLTALFAYVGRSDLYLGAVELAGARFSIALLIALAAAPLFGLLIGAWRYDKAHAGGAIGLAAKLIARAIQFGYVHFLLLATAIALIAALALDVDLEATAAHSADWFSAVLRAAPWLTAYLMGFTLGRAARIMRAARARPNAGADRRLSATPRGRRRAEPLLSEDAGDLRIDNGVAAGDRTTSGLPAPPGAPTEPGFLPPQDLDKLRPKLRDLR